MFSRLRLSVCARLFDRDLQEAAHFQVVGAASTAHWKTDNPQDVPPGHLERDSYGCS